MELGVARNIAVAHIAGGNLEKEINDWLSNNPEVEVIDIKFAASANESDWATDALIIYRKEG